MTNDVDDGRGVSTETAISLIDSDDEEESNAECHVPSEDIVHDSAGVH